MHLICVSTETVEQVMVTDDKFLRRGGVQHLCGGQTAQRVTDHAQELHLRRRGKRVKEEERKMDKVCLTYATHTLQNTLKAIHVFNRSL